MEGIFGKTANMRKNVGLDAMGHRRTVYMQLCHEYGNKGTDYQHLRLPAQVDSVCKEMRLCKELAHRQTSFCSPCCRESHWKTCNPQTPTNGANLCADARCELPPVRTHLLRQDGLRGFKRSTADSRLLEELHSRQMHGCMDPKTSGRHDAPDTTSRGRNASYVGSDCGSSTPHAVLQDRTQPSTGVLPPQPHRMRVVGDASIACGLVMLQTLFVV